MVTSAGSRRAAVSGAGPAGRASAVSPRLGG